MRGLGIERACVGMEKERFEENWGGGRAQFSS